MYARMQPTAKAMWIHISVLEGFPHTCTRGLKPHSETRTNRDTSFVDSILWLISHFHLFQLGCHRNSNRRVLVLQANVFCDRAKITLKFRVTFDFNRVPKLQSGLEHVTFIPVHAFFREESNAIP